MTNNFDDWSTDSLDDDSFDFDEFDVTDSPELSPVIGLEEDDDDEFARLRQKSARAGTVSDDMEMEEVTVGEGRFAAFSLSNFTTGQRLILAFLLLLDILMIGFGLLVITGRF
ncbi:MAG: hypothetical protein Kow0080_03770 [Candidatus Promineifilaceae bacterium]